MMKINMSAASAAIVALMSFGFEASALAGMTDFEFQLVENKVKSGKDAVVAVRLVDRRTGKGVPDAVIFETRADMAPDGMETMTTPIEATASDEPDIYRFKVALVMAGGWRISLKAKVQGEEGTLNEQVVLEATE
ncbi:FixH family protein [Aurantimonas coralicida]|uniref:FixH family protein n=1 Tax=Aurantimonas coralicida TaxID=182270 RepID=UPI00165D6350|nr:FixH family protein [Aurantimonas coralicida]MCD1645435.1 FixH family protein [Aurantimonas coralicida]MCW7546307.1 FixH family protein [Aurantimonas litoralis]|tara:strand:+ start:593 stop:997 length:405 start_codon:yes stop_codon:yes gene_type:complete